MEYKIIFGPRKCTFQNDEFTLIYNLGCKVTSQANLDLVTQQFLFQRITFSFFIFSGCLIIFPRQRKAYQTLPGSFRRKQLTTGVFCPFQVN